jgi:arsenite-transporting ATPase
VALALERRGAQALTASAGFLARWPVTEVPLRAHNLLGLPALRALAQHGHSDVAQVSNLPDRRLPAGSPSAESAGPADSDASGLESRDTADWKAALPAALESLTDLVDDLARAGRGVIMTMGKGGVGKTTIAAAIATELARRGFKVRLSTTDPAAHVAAAAGQIQGLHVSRIDPQAETRAYVEQVMATAGKDLDASGRALLEEDLRSPCTEEIAVFRAFARAVDGGKNGFVVLDTAPTGHTILLLDAALAYHREVTRQTSGMPPEVEQLLPRLRDPRLTRVLLVTLPEATPVHEAAKLQEDLNRAGIRPFAWVINQSLTPLAVTDPVLRSRQAHEAMYIREVIDRHADRTVLVPWQRQAPVGADRLRELADRRNTLAETIG